jgi:G2/mitotic-specific cyclin-B, other
VLLCSRRRQAACGLTEKPKEPIEDIDKFDGDNQLALVDYVEDIYTFYKTAQVTAGSSSASHVLKQA